MPTNGYNWLEWFCKVGFRFSFGGQIQLDFGGWAAQHFIKFLHQVLAGVVEGDLAWRFFTAKDTGKHVPFGGQSIKHPFLDGAFGHQVDDIDGMCLAVAMGPGNSLIQHGGMPR